MIGNLDGFEAPQTRIKVFCDSLAQLPCDQGEVDGLVANCVFRHSSTRKCDELNNLGITHLMKIAKIYHVSVYIEICVYGRPELYSIYLLCV